MTSTGSSGADVSPARRYNMSRIRNKNTKPEMAIRAALHQRGLRFRVHVSDLPGRPDLVLRRHHAVIFVHGCFWHRHAGCRYTTVPKTRQEFWLKKFADNVARDARKERELIAAGWRVFVAWECDIRASAADAACKLDMQIRFGVTHG